MSYPTTAMLVDGAAVAAKRTIKSTWCENLTTRKSDPPLGVYVFTLHTIEPPGSRVRRRQFSDRSLIRCSLDQRACVCSNSRVGLSVYIVVSINALENLPHTSHTTEVVVHGRPVMVPHGESPGVSSGYEVGVRAKMMSYYYVSKWTRVVLSTPNISRRPAWTEEECKKPLHATRCQKRQGTRETTMGGQWCGRCDSVCVCQ
jgi:hypothetical protein